MFCQCCFSIQLTMEPDKCWCLRHCKKGAGPSSSAAACWLGQAYCPIGLAFVFGFNSTAAMLCRKMRSQVLSLNKSSA